MEFNERRAYNNEFVKKLKIIYNYVKQKSEVDVFYWPRYIILGGLYVRLMKVVFMNQIKKGDISMKDVFHIKGVRTLILRKEKDKYITFNPIKLEYYTINEIGAEILYLVSQNRTKESIIRYFVDKYLISSIIFEKDMMAFINSFGALDVIKNNLKKLKII